MQSDDVSRVRTARMQHYGEGPDLFAIFIVNVLLKVITLGIYHFWAKTRIRGYLWSQSAFDEERFEYGGFGKELFFGFLKAVAVFIPLLFLVNFLSSTFGAAYPVLGALAGLILYLGAYVLIGVGSYSARRYLLSRTRWRAIRFGQSGSALTFAMKLLGHSLLLVLTLGLYYPVRRQRILAYKINNTWFGNERFTYSGRGGDLFGRFFVTYLLTAPTLGLIWFWYLAAEIGYIAQHTRLGGVEFDVNYSGGQLFGLRTGNLLLLVVTLGFAYPWVVLRNFRFLFGHLTVKGRPDYAAIVQSGMKAPTTGEGLAEIFGVGGSVLGLGRV